jgi:tetratricopeptide (TPR) repeat protein
MFFFAGCGMSKSNQATTTEAEVKPSLGRMLVELVRRLVSWIWTHPLQAGIVAGVVMMPVVPIIVVQLTLRYQFGANVKQRGLREALEALDSPLPGDELGGRPFVLGVVADRRAAQLLDQSQRRFELLAVNYLEEARTLGFPPGRRADGLYLLGKNLYRTGQFAASLPVLQEALPLNPKRRTELHRYLAGAYLAESPPKFREAQAHNAQYLADKRLSSAERQAGLLERGRIELGLNNFNACSKTLAQIPADSPSRSEALLLQGQLLSGQARGLTADDAGEARQAAFRKAIETFNEAQRRDATPATIAAAKYLIGRCENELGNDKAALKEFDRALERYLETDAGIAAGFEAAQLLCRQKRYAAALERYRTVFRGLDATRPLSNVWVAPDALRADTLESYHELVRAKQFDLAIELAGLLKPLFNEERGLQLQADASRQWGQELLTQVAAAPAAQAAELEHSAREKLREAGRSYLKLARLRAAAREFPDDLYSAAECFRSGHEYEAAIAAFREYLVVESRRRRPRALIGLGESLLAHNEPAEALASLEECIESHTRDAAVFEARLLASQARLEKGEVQAAEKLLLDNLDGEALTPASQEWRDSLFALGRLLYQAGRFRDAIQRLEEAVARYPKLPAATEARYLIAEAYRRHAQEIREQGLNEATAEGRLARNREATQLLETSLKDFDLERDQLLARQEYGALSALDEAILRNCFFARGAVLFELGRYREAIEAYSGATNRYHRHPEVLQAYVQIAACYRRLGQPVEARSTLEQAKYALKHLPEDAVLDGATNYSREEWDRILDTLETL